MFIGLVLGGFLAAIDWRLVFLISVPFGIFGTIWSRLSLREIGVHRRAPIDWAGNVTFAGGLVLVMIGITYGIRPYGDHPMGWTSPLVLGTLAARRRAARCSFVYVETHIAGADVPAAAVPDPRVHLRRPLQLPLGDRARRPDVHADHLAAGDLAARARLQLRLDAALGRHLHAPAHGRDAARRTDLRHPLRPLRLARRSPPAACSARPLAFVLLERLPIDFSYPAFAAVLFLMGLSMGAFASPNRAERDEQPPGAASRRRRRHEPDVPELRPGALDRDLLHADDHRALGDAAAHARRRTRGARRSRRHRRARRAPPAHLGASSPRSSASTRCRS